MHWTWKPFPRTLELSVDFFYPRRDRGGGDPSLWRSSPQRFGSLIKSRPDTLLIFPMKYFPQCTPQFWRSTKVKIKEVTVVASDWIEESTASSFLDALEADIFDWSRSITIIPRASGGLLFLANVLSRLRFWNWLGQSGDMTSYLNFSTPCWITFFTCVPLWLVPNRGHQTAGSITVVVLRRLPKGGTLLVIWWWFGVHC